jgi:hypothetical protein
MIEVNYMAINVNVNLENHEKELLCNILDCEEANLNSSLELFAKASFEEYLRMFLGQKVFTRGSDMKEYRLLLLIKSVFNNQIPDEQKVCDLFQLTLSESRSLIRSVMSKYQYELKDAINVTLKNTIINAQHVNNEYYIDIKTENLVRELNSILGSIDGNLSQVSKKIGTISTYVIKPSAYAKLLTCNQLKSQIGSYFKDILHAATPEKDRRDNIVNFKITTPHDDVILQINLIIHSLSPALQKVDKVKSSIDTYNITVPTYSTLMSNL